MLSECLGSHRREKVLGFLWLVVRMSHPSSPAPGCTCWIHRHRAVRKSPECLGLQVGGPELGPQSITCQPSWWAAGWCVLLRWPAGCRA